ncbi:MAG: PatB family C-S lyase [Gammaproteobacteria bacterium]|nr:PatB family C-S lyase [Gammaproteobacteria bacterium]
MTMTEFDRHIDRSGTSSAKWDKYQGRDVLPFWVADMDFEAPGFLLDALRARIEHPIFGYTRIPSGLVAAFQSWLERNYHWPVPEEWLVWIPGVVTGLNLAAMATAQPGGGVLIPTPVYYPFRSVPANADQRAIEVPMARDGDRWVMDIDALEAAADADTRILMIANPQNPTGRIYDQAELQELAAFAARRGLVICADEIHCPILLDRQASHRPIASLDTEIALRSISLYAATKAYNVPGLSCAVAVIPDAGLRRRFNQARRDLTPSIGPLAHAASEAAFNDQSGWLERLLAYLRGNHERVLAVAGPRMTPVEGTYLAWIDVRDLGLADPGAHFERFGLGLSDGAAFGGPGFVRFNFGCPRPLLEEGLARFSAAIEGAQTA